MIKNLVFEGGGVLGIGFIGALRYLEEHALLNDVRKVIGSSAGAMIATAVAIGLNSQKLESIFRHTDFSKFADKDVNFFKDAFRIIFKGGLYKGNKLEQWFGDILKEHTGNADITFEDVYKKYGKELVITGTNIDKMVVVYFNQYNYPKMKIRTALRISGGVPFIYKFIKHCNDTYIDGGILDNYPFWYFDDEDNTLGFKFISPDDKKDEIIYYYDKDVNNIFRLSMNIVQALILQLDRVHVHGKFWDKTIAINTNNISSMNLNITDSDKEKLFVNGYEGAKTYFEAKK